MIAFENVRKWMKTIEEKPKPLYIYSERSAMTRQVMMHKFLRSPLRDNFLAILSVERRTYSIQYECQRFDGCCISLPSGRGLVAK
jgi:hypothetical protein